MENLYLENKYLQLFPPGYNHWFKKSVVSDAGISLWAPQPSVQILNK